MKKLEGLSEEMKKGIVGILESQTAKSIGELRKIDKICNKVDEVNGDVLELEDEEFSFLESKVSQFESWNAIKKFRKITLELSDIIEKAKRE